MTLAPDDVRDLARCAECETLHYLSATCPECGAASPPMTENELVDALYRAYAVPLLRFVRHQGSRRGMSESLLDAEGVVHETFTAMLRSHDTIQNPRGWLFAVAGRLVGKCVAELRRRQAGDVPDLDHTSAAQWSSIAPQADTEDIYEARQLLECIAAQSSRQMVAVYLHHVQGWTAKEIGEYLGCAESTASVHVHRGVKRLRDAQHPARRRLRTIGKSGLAALVGGFVADQMIRSWTYQPPPCAEPCAPPPVTPDAPAGDALVPPGPAPLVVVAAALLVLLLGIVVVASRAEPPWLTIRRGRPSDLESLHPRAEQA